MLRIDDNHPPFVIGGWILEEAWNPRELNEILRIVDSPGIWNASSGASREKIPVSQPESGVSPNRVGPGVFYLLILIEL